ncbi:MAG: hypothetical protein K6L76_02255 [Agarilytica sp.]
MNKNIEGLKKHQISRSSEKREAVLKAISELQSLNREINFVTVAKKAGVSRKYIYSQPDLDKLVRSEKPSSIQRERNKVVSLNASSQGQANKIRALSDKCKSLQNENKELKKEVKLLQAYIEKLSGSH